MADLSLVLIEDLIKEFENRFDSFTICGSKQVDNNNHQFVIRGKGSAVEQMGLAEVSKKVALDSMTFTKKTPDKI